LLLSFLFSAAFFLPAPVLDTYKGHDDDPFDDNYEPTKIIRKEVRASADHEGIYPD